MRSDVGVGEGDARSNRINCYKKATINRFLLAKTQFILLSKS